MEVLSVFLYQLDLCLLKEQLEDHARPMVQREDHGYLMVQLEDHAHPMVQREDHGYLRREVSELVREQG